MGTGHGMGEQGSIDAGWQQAVCSGGRSPVVSGQWGLLLLLCCFSHLAACACCMCSLGVLSLILPLDGGFCMPGEWRSEQ